LMLHAARRSQSLNSIHGANLLRGLLRQKNENAAGSIEFRLRRP